MAEPLSILGGVAASIQLIECATGMLLGTIKLVRELRGIPAKTASYVDDVERSSERLSYICRHILSSGSLTAHHIGPASVARLSSVCDSLRKATDNAQANLEPLVEGLDSAKNKPALRLWNSLVSKMRESTIHEELQRLDKLNLELIGEFNVVNLTSQVAIRSTLNETSAAMNNHQLKISEGIESLIELGQMSEASVQSMKSGLESKLDTMSKSHEIDLATTPSFSHQIGCIRTNVNSLTETADLIQHQTLKLDSEIQTQFRLSHDNMERMMQNQEVRMTTRLRSIRDELLTTIAGAQDRNLARVVELDIDQLTTQDQDLLHSGVAVSLLRYPESLLNAFQSSNRNRAQLESRCCHPRIETSSTRLWNFQYQTVRRKDHRNNCDFRFSGTQFWNQSLSASLYPFLNRVVDVSLGAMTGPGTWTMLPSLRLRKIVERSKSPVFSAFDQLLDLCARKNGYYCMRRYLWDDNYELGPKPPGGFAIEWNSCTADRLKDLESCLRQKIAQGRFSGEETDEHGFTILFEFCNLIILFSWQWKEFKKILTVLLDTILQSRVDVLAKTVFDERLRHYGIANYRSASWARDNVTAAEYLLSRGYTGMIQIGWEIPLYDHLLRAGTIDGLQTISDHEGTAYNYPKIYRKLPLKLLLQHTEVAEALEYDDLAVAIIKRSLYDVRLLAGKPCFCSSVERIHEPRRTYLELALGWEEGIQYLLDRGFAMGPALALACQLGDAMSLRILLKSQQPIFIRIPNPNQSTDFDSSLWIVEVAIASMCRDILTLTLSEMRERRRRLYHKVAQNYSKHELSDMCLDESSILSKKGALTLQILASKVSSDPELAFCSEFSPYHFALWRKGYGVNDPTLRTCKDVFDTFYDSGFTDLDEMDEKRGTPMFWHVRNSFPGNKFAVFTFEAGQVVEWFVAHGASVTSPADDGWPNILFYIAFCASEAPDSFSCDDWGTNQLITTVEDLQTATDTCRCFCSSFGCLPIHLMLRCYFRRRDKCVHTIGRREMFRLWKEKWRLGVGEQDILLKEMVRLELFERLGMAHTCCRHDWGDYTGESFSVHRVSDLEEERMQNEDSELLRQLERLMEYYQAWASRFQGKLENFHEAWWAIVDEILLPLSATEGCESLHWVRGESMEKKDQARKRDAGKELREAKEKDALRKAGYEDWSDFHNVIDVHFEKRLETCS